MAAMAYGGHGLRACRPSVVGRRAALAAGLEGRAGSGQSQSSRTAGRGGPGTEEETPGIHRPRFDPGSPLISWTS